MSDLIKLQKGTISVQSDYGKGSVFEVFIPAVEPISTPKQSNDADETHKSDTVVLVVEDDDGIFSFIRSILLENKIEVLRAGDGLSGYSLAHEKLPDLIITDIMMPLGDGITMTRKLKNNEIVNHIPIIVLSSKTSAESRLEGLTAGVDAYLGKPFHPEELLLLVQNLTQTIRNNHEKFSKNLKESQKSFKERVANNDLYLLKIVSCIEAHMMETDYSVNELAAAMCVSRSQLHRKIKALTDLSTTHLIRIIRLEKAKDLLKSNYGNITEIAYACGFNTQSYFTKSFIEHFGMSPTEFLK